jgi:uncharacterized protein (DUF362 family)
MGMVASEPVAKSLRETITKVLNQIGGISRYVPQDSRVLIKPNFNTADPFPASTDIDFLREVTEIVYEQNPKEIIIGESSTMFASTESVMKEKSMDTFKTSRGTPTIMNFDLHEWVEKEIPQGHRLKKLKIPAILDEIDVLLYLRCCKTHKIAHLTGSLKLSVGMMKPQQRMKLHAFHFHDKIADINLAVRPDLIIMDARKCFISGGPDKGTVREPNLIIAGENRVELDIEAAKVIQGYEGNSLKDMDPKDIPHILAARAHGIK